MPRTINATLKAALDTGSFSAFFQLRVGFPYQYLQVVSYTLSPFGELKVKALSETEIVDIDNVVLRRGVVISGNQYYLDTSELVAHKIGYDGYYYEIEADVLPNKKVSIAADVTYETLLTNFANDFNFDVNLKNPTAGYWDNKFYPTGRSLTVNRARQLRSILKQKFFMGCTDYGGNTLHIFFNDNSDSDGTITVKQLVEQSQSFVYGLNTNIALLWRNDAGTIFTSNLASLPIYNLGYIRDGDKIPYAAGTLTTASASAGQRIKSTSKQIKPITLAPNLEYLTGDQVKILSSTTGVFAIGTLLVEEYLNTDIEPAWGIKISLWDYVTSTEGGALPGTIEQAAPYTPLNTSEFSSILSSTDNNLQAAMDTLDNHDHSGLATTEGIQDIIGAMVSSNAETGITVTYDDTNGKLDFDAQTAGDARYAPIAKGVTNGDNHDHVGGDGAVLPFLFPMATYINLNPITASNQAPYGGTVEATLTFVKWSMGFYTAGAAHDNSNYYTFTLKLRQGAAASDVTIATLDTKTLTSNNGVVFSTTTFSPTGVTGTGYLYIISTKTGAPADTYVLAPALRCKLT